MKKRRLFDEEPKNGYYTDGPWELWAMILMMGTLLYSLFFQ